VWITSVGENTSNACVESIKIHSHIPSAITWFGEALGHPPPFVHQGTAILFSTTFRYSLISLIELAAQDRTLQARQIADKYDLSHHYLSVVLRELRLLGLVESSKGNRGGYRLVRRADEVNLLDLYNSLAGGHSELPTTKGDQPGSPADAWLEQLIQNWSQDLKSVSLLDLCKFPVQTANE
jgi:Rrf2 family protein